MHMHVGRYASIHDVVLLSVPSAVIPSLTKRLTWDLEHEQQCQSTLCGQGQTGTAESAKHRPRSEPKLAVIAVLYHVLDD